MPGNSSSSSGRRIERTSSLRKIITATECFTGFIEPILVAVKGSQPIAKLPQVVQHDGPSGSVLSVGGAKPPSNIRRRWEWQKGRPSIPVQRYQPKIKPHERPADTEMSHRAVKPPS